MDSYCCVPQDNSVLQGLAIASLSIYASIASHFVVIAPPTPNKLAATEFNAQTYLHRGWCRLEQWAKLAVGGLGSMYIFDAATTGGGAEALTPLSDRPEWIARSLQVFEGTFSYEEDKLKLVDTVLGLWAHAFVDKDDVFQAVSERKSAIFPEKYFGDLVEILEEELTKRGARLDGGLDGDPEEMSTRTKLNKLKVKKAASTIEIKVEMDSPSSSSGGRPLAAGSSMMTPGSRLSRAFGASSKRLTTTSKKSNSQGADLAAPNHLHLQPQVESTTTSAEALATPP